MASSFLLFLSSTTGFTCPNDRWTGKNVTGQVVDVFKNKKQKGLQKYIVGDALKICVTVTCVCVSHVTAAWCI